MKDFKYQIITNEYELNQCEKVFRLFPENEYVPSARRVGNEMASYTELAETVFPDRGGTWAHPLWIVETYHDISIGVDSLCRYAYDFLSENKDAPVDILSVMAGVQEENLALIFLVRVYKGLPDIIQLENVLGERSKEKPQEVKKLLIPESAIRHYSVNDIQEHKEKWEKQEEEKERSDIPFLNAVHEYVPQKLYDIDPEAEPVYDLKAIERSHRKNFPDYDQFIACYQAIKKTTITNNEGTYYRSFKDPGKKKIFYSVLEYEIRTNYLETGRIRQETLPLLKEMLEMAFFQYDVLQTPINDPTVTDIHVDGPFSIRVKVDGRWYLSNLTFVDEKDYERFMNGLVERNEVSLKEPTPIFTDNQTDDNYILRFSLTLPEATSNGCYALHVSKQPKDKLLFKNYTKNGKNVPGLASESIRMLPLHVMDYVIDRMRTGRGVIIAGAPRSGKTVFLNAVIEPGYENSAQILIIQESDELFPYRNGVTVQHVIPAKGVTLEKLSQSANVSGSDVFIIGEVKGNEAAEALKIAASGTRVALTVHGESAIDAVNRYALLAMIGMPNLSREQAGEMIASAFDTVIYMENFHVQEIVEMHGYDDREKHINWKKVYEYNPDDKMNQYYPAPSEKKENADTANKKEMV